MIAEKKNGLLAVYDAKDKLVQDKLTLVNSKINEGQDSIKQKTFGVKNIWGQVLNYKIGCAKVTSWLDHYE